MSEFDIAMCKVRGVWNGNGILGLDVNGLGGISYFEHVFYNHKPTHNNTARGRNEWDI